MEQWPKYNVHFVLRREGDTVLKQCRTPQDAARYGEALRQEAACMQRLGDCGLFPRYEGFVPGALPGVRMEYLPGGPLRPLYSCVPAALERQTAQVLGRVLRMARTLEQAGVVYWDFRLANLIGEPQNFRMIDFTGAEMPGCPDFTRGQAFQGTLGSLRWERLGDPELRRIAALNALAMELLGVSAPDNAPTAALRALLRQGYQPARGMTAEAWLNRL